MRVSFPEGARRLTPCHLPTHPARPPVVSDSISTPPPPSSLHFPFAICRATVVSLPVAAHKGNEGRRKSASCWIEKTETLRGETRASHPWDVFCLFSLILGREGSEGISGRKKLQRKDSKREVERIRLIGWNLFQLRRMGLRVSAHFGSL